MWCWSYGRASSFTIWSTRWAAFAPSQPAWTAWCTIKAGCSAGKPGCSPPFWRVLLALAYPLPWSPHCSLPWAWSRYWPWLPPLWGIPGQAVQAAWPFPCAFSLRSLTTPLRHSSRILPFCWASPLSSPVWPLPFYWGRKNNGGACSSPVRSQPWCITLWVCGA